MHNNSNEKPETQNWKRETGQRSGLSFCIPGFLFPVVHSNPVTRPGDGGGASSAPLIWAASAAEMPGT